MFKKKTIGMIAGIGLIIGLNIPSSVKADENLKVKVQSTPSSITLDWNDLGVNYQLYDNNQKLWEGNDSEYIHTNLPDNDQHSYYLRAFNQDGDTVDELSIRTFTKKAKNTKVKTITSLPSDEEKLSNITVASSVNDQELTIEWDQNIPDDDGDIEIFKNGVNIGTTTKNTFIDKDIEQDTDYLYEFVGKKRISEEKIQDILNDYKKRNVTITPAEEDDLFYNTFNLTRNVSTKIEHPTIATAAVVTDFTLRYTTFIPMKYASNPWPLWPLIPYNGPTYFNGNDRGFDKNSTRFKTRMDVKISFPNNIGTASLTSTNKHVEKSILYDQNYKIISERNASSAGMNIRDVTSGTGKVSFNAYHDIGLPYFDSITPDITYAFNATIYPNGGYIITGSHDKAPSHEIYLTNNSNIIRVVHQREHVGFLYLAPPYPNYTINSSY
ncbi:hypothetical protein [Priestia koreensis]|uniref:hypothetical protein n=1 Tax=Priestia koreensis TaxID=284581 RepID=UPI0020407A4B|nr:hypothetical protein [Priestia koreensis]MCM3005749.1 hypothetical protein [Priestia koreensis]